MKLLLISALTATVLTFLITFLLDQRKKGFKVTKPWKRMIKPLRLAESHLLVNDTGDMLARRLPVWVDFSLEEPLIVILRFSNGQEFPLARADLKQIVDLVVERRTQQERSKFTLSLEDYLVEVDAQHGATVFYIKEHGLGVQWSVLVLNSQRLQAWIDSTYTYIDKQAGEEKVIHDQIDREWKVLAESLEKE